MPELKISKPSAFKRWRTIYLSPECEKLINSTKFKILVFDGKIKIIN
jgi:hypothetical protein